MLDRIRQRAAELGWWNALLLLVSRVCERATTGHVKLIKYELMVQPLGPDPLLPSNRGVSVDVHEVAPDHPLLLSTTFRDPAILQARFESGARCFLAECRGQLAGFLWVTQGEYLEDEVRCRFLAAPVDRAVWDFDVYVVDSYRLTPVFARLWDVTREALRAQGVRHSCSRISAFNQASIRAHRHLGAIKVGWLAVIVLGSWQCFFSNQRPWLWISWFMRSRPLFVLGDKQN
ncbi:GNAT family N-acetyltransferase [Ectothiorhodospira sp. BSL-9]|uniref:GNAT family N-acetyltransferase n=1 Tax=Ectothiorhodospira sp. BSL-9 TaxID=1442136 RepID=UPI0007B435C9|nr:hypothetical protein [Ectothiorhodospira sp. BSL-9]ANB02209.1 hypothetical protein ECTOBSL9_1546 [Ectothiorhodospira sp. BSL-9]